MTTAGTISADARLVAVGDEYGAVQVYEAAPEPHVTALYSSHDGERVSVAALGPSGRLLALVRDGRPGRDVLLMDLRTGATSNRFHRESERTLSLMFAPDGLSLFESEGSRHITQRDLHSGLVLREFSAPEPPGPREPKRRLEPTEVDYLFRGTNQLRVSPDGRILARARDDGLIGLWDVPSGRWTDWLDSGTSETVVIDFSPDGRTLAAHHPEKLVLWDVQSRQPKRTTATDRSFPAVRFSPDGAFLACGNLGRIRFFDAATGGARGENSDPHTSGYGMVFHPGGPLFIASAFDSTIRLWDVRTGRELLSLQKHTAVVRSLLLTPDGNTLISTDQSGTVLVWDLTYYNGRIRRELNYRASHVQ